MAGGTLFTLLDDIASVLDDVASATKTATTKTAGVLGDDLALSAEQVSGVPSNRELPIIWEVVKGSAKNKAILVPAALLLSWFLPWTIAPLLMLGGAYLCYEGFEKVFHKYLPHEEDAPTQEMTSKEQGPTDPALREKERVEGAVKTDFILSAEVVVIVLGAVSEERFLVQLLVLVGMATLMTIFVYGLVALIVRLDDFGLGLLKEEEPWKQQAGRLVLQGAPYLMRTLNVVGTAAMFLVGGGIFVHGIDVLHALEMKMEHSVFGLLGPLLLNGFVGVLVGGLSVGAVILFRRWRKSVQFS